MDAGPETVAEALLDVRFQDSLSDLRPLASREVLSQEKGPDGLLTRRIRCVLGLDISGAARKLIGAGNPAWVEKATWHPHEMRWRWEIEPEQGANLLEANGTIELRPSGAGTERTVTGKVIVKVPLYGSKVERRIVEGLQQAYAEEARRLSEWLS